jgi:hypothetical protein
LRTHGSVRNASAFVRVRKAGELGPVRNVKVFPATDRLNSGVNCGGNYGAGGGKPVRNPVNL